MTKAKLAQTGIIPIFRFNLIKGINNLDESYRFGLSIEAMSKRPVRYFENIENLDIDNSEMIVSRPGCDKKVSGTLTHSCWASEDLCFFVDSGVLYRLNTDYTTTEVYSPIVGRVSYARFNDRIYFSDGAFIGYYKDGVVTAIQNPNMEFKAPLPAGQKLMVHGAKLHVASGPVLYIGDALKDCFDTRNGYRAFNDDIAMAVSVSTGFYIADQNTWWVGGIVPEEYNREKVFDTTAIPGTEVVISGSAFAESKGGDLAMWVSPEGICVGDQAGKVVNLTKERYALASHGAGAAMVRNINNITHYLTSLE